MDALRCKCGASMVKTTPRLCYGERALCSCDDCGGRIPVDDVVYHCTKGRSVEHENGYDYCWKCAERLLASTSSSATDPTVTGSFLRREKIVWQLSEEQTLRCAAASKGENVASEKIQFSNSTLWNLDLFPRGTARGKTGFMALLLRWNPELNREAAGVRECVIHVRLAANGEQRATTHTYDDSTRSMGFPMGRTPAFSSAKGFAVQMTMTFVKLQKVREKPSLEEWFSAVPYTRYRHALRLQGYDTLEAVSLLDDAELRRVGVAAPGHRRVFLRAIQELKAEHCFL